MRKLPQSGICRHPPASDRILEAMRYICLCDPKRLFAFRIGEATLLQLANLTEAYLATQLERGFSTLDFYKSLYIGDNHV